MNCTTKQNLASYKLGKGTFACFKRQLAVIFLNLDFGKPFWRISFLFLSFVLNTWIYSGQQGNVHVLLNGCVYGRLLIRCVDMERGKCFALPKLYLSFLKLQIWSPYEQLAPCII